MLFRSGRGCNVLGRTLNRRGSIARQDKGSENPERKPAWGDKKFDRRDDRFYGIIRDMKDKVSTIRVIFGIRAVGAFDVKRRIARYSRGNVRLQLGQILTAPEYEAQKKRVLAHDFR